MVVEEEPAEGSYHKLTVADMEGVIDRLNEIKDQPGEYETRWLMKDQEAAK